MSGAGGPVLIAYDRAAASARALREAAALVEIACPSEHAPIGEVATGGQ
jgi:hypothetical protein